MELSFPRLPNLKIVWLHTQHGVDIDRWADPPMCVPSVRMVLVEARGPKLEEERFQRGKQQIRRYLQAFTNMTHLGVFTSNEDDGGKSIVPEERVGVERQIFDYLPTTRSVIDCSECFV